MKRNLLTLLILFIGFCTYAQSNNDASGNYTTAPNDEIKISIYPNPASDYINVQDKDNVLSNVIIYNLAGRRIKSFNTESNQLLNITDLPKGMYLIQFLDKGNKLLTTQRLSKK